MSSLRPSVSGSGRVRGADQPSGAYDINILNVMGREQKAARNKLYQQAIMNPEGYLEHRGQAESDVVDKMVESQYKHFKELLFFGKLNGTQIFKLPDGSEYAPRLPEATVTKFAIKVCETVEKILEEAIEECYPMKYGDLAHKKSAELANAVNHP